MRKFIQILLIATLLTTFNTAFAAEGKFQFDTTEVNKGVVAIHLNGKLDTKTKLMIEKSGEKVVYNLSSNRNIEKLPLQFGNGEYTISVLENTTGNKYKVISQEKVKLDIQNENIIYLNSIQNVNWNEEMAAIKKAKELTKNAKTDEEKVKIIYQYILQNVSYDFDKISTLTTDYVPNIEDTFKTNKGICYDYAALFAGMLRSVGVPTKLVKGYTTEIKEYHAWNEVYVNGKWQVIDTTIDSEKQKAKVKISMIKDAKLYSKVNQY